MPLAFAEVAVPAEATVPRSRPCALASVGRRCLSASKLLYLGFMWEQEMKLEGRLNSLSLILWHPDCAPGLRFPGGQDEDWLWSLGFSLGEVNGKCGSKAVLQRALGQPPQLSQFGSLQFHCLILCFFFPPAYFLISSPRPPLPLFLHHFPLPAQPCAPVQLFPQLFPTPSGRL